MNLLYGTITEIFEENDMRMARIRVAGAQTVVALDLVPDASVGERILVCNGVAIERVKEALGHVPGNSW
ncbi:MAG: HypC/HybG/HupF family hydrogenase formation chaperone [Verrucomicrobia bacterium]|nr:HypC/HybG/HupF family hydrogenase formation chaperone [Kiritimatiellia bacterium]MCO6400746.1 HypC/HybG/HupF family hydrogenase formation chaperone [Verrucomicrobiota bacterium]